LDKAERNGMNKTMKRAGKGETNRVEPSRIKRKKEDEEKGGVAGEGEGKSKKEKR